MSTVTLQVLIIHAKIILNVQAMKTTLIPQDKYCLLSGKGDSICGRPLDHSDPTSWPFGRCQIHCRKVLEDGSLCDNPVMGNGFCYKHGGRTEQALQVYWDDSLTAAARAEKLSPSQRKVYDLAMMDPDALSLRADLSLIEVRLQELLDQLDSWGSEKLLTELEQEIRATSKSLIARGNEIKRETKKKEPNIEAISLIVYDLMEAGELRDLKGLISSGMRTYDTWHEIENLLSRRKQLADSERKRLVEKRKMITGDEALAVIAVIMEKLNDVVERHCEPDLARQILGEFSAEVRRVVGSDQ